MARCLQDRCEVSAGERFDGARTAFAITGMLCSGIGDGTDMGEPVEPAVDTKRVPGAVLLSSEESGCHARVHRQIDVAIVDTYEDHLIEVVAQIGLMTFPS